MSKKSPGRQPKADSLARVQELRELHINLVLQYLKHPQTFEQLSFEKLRNLIWQSLDKEPAYRAMEKDKRRAQAVHEVYAKSGPLKAAVAIASKRLADTEDKGRASTIRRAYQQRDPTAKALAPLWKPLDDKLATVSAELAEIERAYQSQLRDPTAEALAALAAELKTLNDKIATMFAELAELAELAKKLRTPQS